MLITVPHWNYCDCLLFAHSPTALHFFTPNFSACLFNLHNHDYGLPHKIGGLGGKLSSFRCQVCFQCFLILRSALKFGCQVCFQCFLILRSALKFGLCDNHFWQLNPQPLKFFLFCWKKYSHFHNIYNKMLLLPLLNVKSYEQKNTILISVISFQC